MAEPIKQGYFREKARETNHEAAPLVAGGWRPEAPGLPCARGRWVEDHLGRRVDWRRLQPPLHHSLVLLLFPLFTPAISGGAGGISRLGPLIKALKAVKLVHTPIIIIAIV